MCNTRHEVNLVSPSLNPGGPFTAKAAAWRVATARKVSGSDLDIKVWTFEHVKHQLYDWLHTLVERTSMPCSFFKCVCVCVCVRFLARMKYTNTFTWVANLKKTINNVRFQESHGACHNGPNHDHDPRRSIALPFSNKWVHAFPVYICPHFKTRKCQKEMVHFSKNPDCIWYVIAHFIWMNPLFQFCHIMFKLHVWTYHVENIMLFFIFYPRW